MKKKGHQIKKLRVCRETLRALDCAAAEKVAGGFFSCPSGNMTCCPDTQPSEAECGVAKDQ